MPRRPKVAVWLGLLICLHGPLLAQTPDASPSAGRHLATRTADVTILDGLDLIDGSGVRRSSPVVRTAFTSESDFLTGGDLPTLEPLAENSLQVQFPEPTPPSGPIDTRLSGLRPVVEANPQRLGSWTHPFQAVSESPGIRPSARPVPFAFLHPPPGRHGGVGEPMVRESWRFRPFSFGWFIGATQGSSLIDDWVDQTTGLGGGYRLGWDYDHYWGCETRISFGWIELADGPRDLELGDRVRNRFDDRRGSDLFFWDVSLLYYPWGDTPLRPYLLAGLGAARIDFVDQLSVRRAETALTLPLAVGLKYRWNEWLAGRAEFTDNIAFAQQFNTTHNIFFTAGFEVRFGGSRKAYWPWNPGRHYW